jgi:hypothetical protein
MKRPPEYFEGLSPAGSVGLFATFTLALLAVNLAFGRSFSEATAPVSIGIAIFPVLLLADRRRQRR